MGWGPKNTLNIKNIFKDTGKFYMSNKSQLDLPSSWIFFFIFFFARFFFCHFPLLDFFLFFFSHPSHHFSYVRPLIHCCANVLNCEWITQHISYEPERLTSFQRRHQRSLNKRDSRLNIIDRDNSNCSPEKFFKVAHNSF